MSRDFVGGEGLSYAFRAVRARLVALFLWTRFYYILLLNNPIWEAICRVRPTFALSAFSVLPLRLQP